MVSADVGHLAPTDHAEAIGQLVIAWSGLEHAADEIIMRLGVLDGSYGSIVLGHVDFRDKLGILRSLGFVKQPNEEWFAFLEKTVNQIDNVLRPFRNGSYMTPGLFRLADLLSGWNVSLSCCDRRLASVSSIR